MHSQIMETATFAAGCFWCYEPIFKSINGVKSVIPGYSGGHVANPTYQQVVAGETGHAEAFQVQFDPNIVSYSDLLEVFWAVHDPTSLNRQGADVGNQYRSVIFYHSPQQLELAKQSLAAKASEYPKPIVTQIEEYSEFFQAEDYHHNYFTTNPNQPYCSLIIAPKLENFRQKFGSLLSN